MYLAGARLIIGFLIAPGVPALIACVINMAAGGTLGEAIWVLEGFSMMGYSVAIILGIPSYLLFKARRITGLLCYLSMGGIIGLISIVLVFIPYVFSGQWQTYPQEALTTLRSAAAMAFLAMISGVVASSVFWFIAIRRFSFSQTTLSDSGQ